VSGPRRTQPPQASAAPETALDLIGAALRDDEVIAPYVLDPEQPPVLGLLVAAGPRAAGGPGDYAMLVEAVREGYLLHYGEPRLLGGADADLRLLAGDYLYALGLERLASRGDLEAVRELADLISLSAQLHADGGRSGSEAGALWLASMLVVAGGATAEHERGKGALRDGDPAAGDLLIAAATAAARRIGVSEQLAAAAALLVDQPA
jgi:hypothetical protein